VSIANTSSRTVTADVTGGAVIDATNGITFGGSNYIIYGNNNVSQVALGTRAFSISTTIRFSSSVSASQHVLATCADSGRHGLLLFCSGNILYILMYNSTGSSLTYTTGVSTNTDYTITIERTLSSYTVLSNGNATTRSGLAADYFNGAVDCGSKAIRLGGMSAGNSSESGANYTAQPFIGYIKHFSLRFP
jgi:hypothetical protein